MRSRSADGSSASWCARSPPPGICPCWKAESASAPDRVRSSCVLDRGEPADQRTLINAHSWMPARDLATALRLSRGGGPPRSHPQPPRDIAASGLAGAGSCKSEARPHRYAEIERHPGDLVLPLSDVMRDGPARGQVMQARKQSEQLLAA